MPTRVPMAMSANVDLSYGQRCCCNEGRRRWRSRSGIKLKNRVRACAEQPTVDSAQQTTSQERVQQMWPK